MANLNMSKYNNVNNYTSRSVFGTVTPIQNEIHNQGLPIVSDEDSEGEPSTVKNLRYDKFNVIEGLEKYKNLKSILLACKNIKKIEGFE